MTVSEPPGETELALMVKVGAWLTVKFSGRRCPAAGAWCEHRDLRGTDSCDIGREIAACRLVLLTNVVGRAPRSSARRNPT